MKKIIFAILILISPFANAQCSDEPVSIEQDSLSYLMNLFLNLDLVIGPDVYNPENYSDLQYVIFHQDTVFSDYKDRGTVHAAIDDSENKESYYCIGRIKNYLIKNFMVGFVMVRGFKDGREEEEFVPMHFNEIPLALYQEYEYATYGVNVDLYWDSGEGMRN